MFLGKVRKSFRVLGISVLERKVGEKGRTVWCRNGEREVWLCDGRVILKYYSRGLRFSNWFIEGVF